MNYAQEIMSLCEAVKYDFKYLKTTKTPLTDEERDKVHYGKAVWHDGTPGVWKATTKSGDVVYGSNTHRAVTIKPNIEDAIKAFHFIKTTS